MKNTTRAAIAATLVGLALPLHAEEVLDKRPYLSPMFAYTFDDADRSSFCASFGNARRSRSSEFRPTTRASTS